MRNPSVTGLVLAGGLGRRMGGCEKGLLPLAGRPLLAHVLERFAPQVGEVLVNVNGDATAYAAFGHPLVADIIPDFAGPLAGLHAGLQVCTTAFLASVPCDTPLLPYNLVARLHAALAQANTPVAAASTMGRLQPAFMLCRREIGDELARYLAAGGRKIHVWLDSIGVLAVPFDDERAFANINTPDDLAQLESSSCHQHAV